MNPSETLTYVWPSTQCAASGPRVGEADAICVRDKGHAGYHRAEISDGHGDVRWSPWDEEADRG